MSIVSENAVLIVGAGVSAPFGVPMGAQMIPRIREGLVSGRNQIYGAGRYPHEMLQYVRAAYSSREQFWNCPHWGVVLSRHEDTATRQPNIEGLNADLEKLRALIDLLDGQTSETIDDFIVENPTYSEILKACIGVEIAKSTYNYSREQRTIQPLNLSARFLPGPSGRPQRNWIHSLINLVRQSIRTGQLPEGRKVRIVSFNYDGILESVLAAQFQNTERPYAEYTNYFEIVHPHGVCGSLNLSPIDQPSELFEWSQSISVVNEPEVRNEAVVRARTTAQEWIRNASQVYAVGFAFAAPNCELLGLRTQHGGSSRYLHYCNYDGNEGIRLAAEKCKMFKNKNATEGSFDRPISVENWLYAGYLGEFSA